MAGPCNLSSQMEPSVCFFYSCFPALTSQNACKTYAHLVSVTLAFDFERVQPG